MKRLIFGLVGISFATALSAQPITKGPGRWEPFQYRAALTGAGTLGAAVDSSNQLSNTLGYPARSSLVIRCGEGNLSVFVNWPQVVKYDGQNFAGQLKTFAVWRIDDGKIEGNLWDIDTTMTAAGEFKNKNALKFLKKIVGARSLVVRLTGRQTQDAEFDLTGIAKVAADVTAACGVQLR